MPDSWVRTRECACGRCRFNPVAPKCPAMVPNELGDYPKSVTLWAREYATEEGDGRQEMQGKGRKEEGRERALNQWR